jgi:LuxR family maltose regulon positive regulatory protein
LLTASRKGVFGTMLELLRAYLYGCLKQPERIPVWLKEGDLSQGVFMYRGMAFPCILAGKAALLEGRYIQLEAMCEGFTEYYGFLHNQLGLLHNAVYLSIAKCHLYGREAGSSALIPAILEAQTDGIVMPFVENAEYLLPLLEEITKSRGVDNAYLGRLISLCKQYKNGLQKSEHVTPQLTLREKEVLAFLAEGLTQKEIADKLYLSVDTVKKYLKLLYSKLMVDNKISAVQKAKKVGLL